jgi:general secretion pathway protein A
LIQIVLVGQPELNNLLGSYRLRQLGQRVTVTCRLEPLTRIETEKYIDYRTSIASGKSTSLFSSRALREIFTFSGGTPRLINIACDRALLAAFIQNQKRISGKVARAAVKELRGPDDRRSFIDLLRFRWLWVLFITGLIILIGFLTVPKRLATDKLQSPTSSESARFPITPKKETPIVQNLAPTSPPENDEVRQTISDAPLTNEQGNYPDRSNGGIDLKGLGFANSAEQKGQSQRPNFDLKLVRSKTFSTGSEVSIAADELKRILGDMGPRESRRVALLAVLRLWKSDPEIQIDRKETYDDLVYFQQGARGNGLEVYHAEQDVSLVAGMGLPAIMAFDFEDGQRYLACERWQGNTVVLSDGQRSIQISVAHLKDNNWSGAYIPWRNFLGLAGTIPKDASAETILTLKMLLRKMGFTEVPLTVKYDEITRGAVETIQGRGGITVDGLVGPETKIVIYNHFKEYWTPHIGADSKGLG